VQSCVSAQADIIHINHWHLDKTGYDLRWLVQVSGRPISG